MKKRFNLKEQDGETSEEELYDSLGTVLGLATTMCNDHENETYDTLDPHEALDCLYEIDTPRAHKLIEMIKFYEDELDSMDAEEDYRDDDEFMDEYGIDESKVIKLKESDLHRIVKRVIKEQLTTHPLSLKRTKAATPNYSKIENLSDPYIIASTIIKGMCYGGSKTLREKNPNMRTAICDDKEMQVAAAFTAMVNANDPYKMYLDVQKEVQFSIGLDDTLIDIVERFIKGVIFKDEKSWRKIINSYNTIMRQAKEDGWDIWTEKKTNNGKEEFHVVRGGGGREIK